MLFKISLKPCLHENVLFVFNFTPFIPVMMLVDLESLPALFTLG